MTSIQQSVTKNVKNMCTRLETSNHHHLLNIYQTIGHEETARKRSKSIHDIVPKSENIMKIDDLLRARGIKSPSCQAMQCNLFVI
ncbi:unnamed protein product [Macrosiphum euphorbiae]|uniref:Uncharacterized protein n=1 Tax=Macrosiphum euphorbiae TaxID=13131 RepID=A0AAV0WWP5_9HEMI|nr:unnamed protein product [Macrosiphum euphorbiae]